MHMADTSSGSGSKVKCYNCGKPGHVARKCPKSALFVRSWSKDNVLERNVTQRGTVESTNVQDIILDTGCSRTLVRKELVPPIKWLEDKAVTCMIKCAHGDTVMYPLALLWKEPVSDTLLVAMLLGHDVLKLNSLLQETRGA